jgi:Ribbon-helix-helix protein, copG family
MAKGNIRKQKKRPRGRSKKADGLDPVVSARLPREVVEAVDAWAADQGVTRHEAVWRLLKQGLAAGDLARLLQAAPGRDFAF